MRGLLVLLGFVSMLALGLAQVAVGAMGLELWIGRWAWVVVVVCLTFRFLLPLTIASYFGATVTFGWSWYWALLFAVPGLALAIPSMVAAIMSDIMNHLRLGSTQRAARTPVTAAPDKKAGLYGIGGWLTVLIALFILRALGALGSTYADLQSASQMLSAAYAEYWPTFVAMVWSTTWLAAIMSFVAGWRLLRQRDSSVPRFAILVLWVSGPAASLAADAELYWLIWPATDALSIGNLFGSLIGAVVFASVWTLYLKQSWRVRNTYGRALGAGVLRRR
ncbi:MAG TPA: DUF2569 family protein [Castellaniella sp.]|uniref:DUF2569 family protein n=1 Tax=Castellaniella sp. TaxID=1955812 RepID=UPI002EE04A07